MRVYNQTNTEMNKYLLSLFENASYSSSIVCFFSTENFEDKLLAKVAYNADTGRAYKVNS